jgi:two-component system response regulator AtoC
MQVVFRTIEKVAEYTTTVLITGESGTGKELVARAIHDRSPRRAERMVAVNCGAIPGALLESELFGHKRGAFTDATADKRGLFEEAHGGTLFLDEIGELPLELQVKLLRALQEGTIRRLGDTNDIAVDVRVLAATVRDLERAAGDGTFREDLYYRLAVLPLRVPSLRERRDDIPILVDHFLERHSARLGTGARRLSPLARKLLVDYRWPGNVRELENLIERLVVLADGDVIEADDLPDHVRDPSDPLAGPLASGELSIKKTARFMEEALIRKALDKTGGNRTAAAKLLEISQRALLYKIKDYGLG